MIYFALILALIWGGLWAAFLQFTAFGRYLSLRRTWITVVVGLGVDLLLLLLVIPLHTWFVVCGVVTASAIGIVIRSVYNEVRDERAALEANGNE